MHFFQKLSNLPAQIVGQLDRAGQSFAENWRAWNRRAAPKMDPAIRVFEIFATLLLVALAGVYLVQFAKTMVTIPLQGDEVGTIRGFSSRGAKYVVTHYGVAKNHIFFNLLNALTPGAQSFAPWRGRLWSFIAFSGLLVAGVTFFWRRKWFLEGGLFFFFMTTTQRALETNLAARGYGFLAFFTLIGCLLVLHYFEKPAWKPILWLSLCTVLGTYTMPQFILYGGVLLLLLFLWTRDARIFLAGAGTIFAIALLYAPVFKQLTHVAEGYADKYGESYPDLNAVFTTFQYYLLQQKPWVVFAGLSGVFVAPFAFWPRGEPTKRALQVLLMAAMLFLAICLEMETPRVRTTGFIVVPFLITGLLAAGRLYRTPDLTLLRPFLIVGCMIPLASGTWEKIGSFHYTPKENFLGSAKIIRSLYPAGVPIHVTERPDKLANTLPPNYLRPLPFDSAAWKRGEMVVLDSDFRAAHRFDPLALDPGAIELRVAQAKGDYQSVCLVPPRNDLVTWSQSDGVVLLNFKDNRPLYSIAWLVGKHLPGSRTQFPDDAGMADKLSTFPTANGTLFVVSHVGKPPNSLRIEMAPDVRVISLWAIPQR